MSASPRSAHWDDVFGRHAPDSVTWYQPHLSRSLALLESLGLDADTRVVDVGAGASTLVDDLLTRGVTDVTVLDVSAEGLAVTRERLGERAASVTFLVSDVTAAPLEPDRYDLWHDRACFHFLTSPEDRAAYVDRARRAVRPGGALVLSTFGPEGPEKCSGLPTRRYDGAALAAAFGPGFSLERSELETHVAPDGREQQFLLAVLRRDAQSG